MAEMTFPAKSLPPLRRNGRIVNAMSVDVEDYFQVQALAGVVDRADWDSQPSRVEFNTHAVLDLFAERGVKATFFTLSWIAERHGDLVRRIVGDGHELASHGSDHKRADIQSPVDFRRDVGEAKRRLEDIGGVAISGYRAPTFSIGAGNLWAFDVLAEEGYGYSSSVYPVRRDNYGMPSAPRFSFFPRAGAAIEEYPISTVRIFGLNLPAGGGGFFRLLPYAVSRAAISHVNAADHQPAIFYFHPWEVDAGQPWFDQLPFKSRFRHYVNLEKTSDRLERLVGDFCWDRMDRVFRPGVSS
jgi:polysaccharide deacetylase family protein (PEP-CTERM system associated)